MKYIRTKDDRIIDLTSKEVSSYEIIDDKTAVTEYGEDSGFICVYYFNSDIGEYIEYDKKGGRSMNSWYLKDILKQADTIKELVDMYVGKYKGEEVILHKWNGNKYVINWATNVTYELKELPKNYEDIKGAIWTSKGLIYVAKMNDKGELELL